MSYLTLVIGDTHFPYENEDTVKKIIRYAQQYKPRTIIQVGDLYDCFSFSKFPRTVNMSTPKDELTAGRLKAESFWASLRKAAPKAKCYQLKGNHDIRPALRMIERLPELESLFDINHLWEFKGVATQQSEKDELILKINGEKVCFIHGYRSKLGDHAKFNHMNTVCGHSHRGGVANVPQLNVWELNAGFCGNADSEALSYAKQRKISAWTQGFGIIDEHGPRFIKL